MPVQLYALTWSQQDTDAIREWSEANAEQVYVSGWSRILLEPLHKAVNDPNIFAMSIDGVVVRDHTTATPDSLKESLKRLNSGMLKLYSTNNGLEPVTIE